LEGEEIKKNNDAVEEYFSRENIKAQRNKQLFIFEN
jgi:hypothetical protein